jgi:hypothetical protein
MERPKTTPLMPVPCLGDIVLPVRWILARVVVIAVRSASRDGVVVPVGVATAAIATTAVSAAVGHDV